MAFCETLKLKEDWEEKHLGFKVDWAKSDMLWPGLCCKVLHDRMAEATLACVVTFVSPLV